MAYRIDYLPRAEKAIRKLDRPVQRQMLTAIGRLADDPRPAGCVKLTGGDNEYRIRVGQYRVIYAVEDERLRVLVLEAGHRRDIYEKRNRKR